MRSGGLLGQIFRHHISFRLDVFSSTFVVVTVETVLPSGLFAGFLVAERVTTCEPVRVWDSAGPL